MTILMNEPELSDDPKNYEYWERVLENFDDTGMGGGAVNSDEFRGLLVRAVKYHVAIEVSTTFVQADAHLKGSISRQIIHVPTELLESVVAFAFIPGS